MRSSRKFRSPLLIVVVLVGLLLFSWWQNIVSPVDSDSQTAQIFVIPKGQAIGTIGNRLYEAKLIRSTAAFKLVVKKENLSKKIQAGDFRLRSSMNLEEIAEALTHGTLDLWVTLLEGWRLEEIAQELASVGFDAAAFVASASDQEGYLFPDTYLLARDASATAVTSVLRNTFDQKVDFSANQSGLTDHQVIVLASIVEREVRTDKDRALVAGILLKRLENDWPLQADATVQYIKGSHTCSISIPDCNWWPQNLTLYDIELNSAYNTYQNQGLPPNPIANPGLASINGVLNPQVSPHWYYISDLQGNIHYAKDLDEHNANIARYLNK